VEASPGIGRALVVSGGPAPDAAEVGPLPSGAFVIAADSGLEHATALGVRVERHPVDKEATDLELALEQALELGATRVTVVSGGGGARLDHHLAELVLLAAVRFAPLHIDARIGSARAVAIHAGEAVALTGETGAMLTLLALGGPAHGVTTKGLRWPLRGETLYPGSTRGVSNVIEAPIRIAISSGSLLAVGSRPLERVDQAYGRTAPT
jgi:thiamine pyrophosphokinase